MGALLADHGYDVLSDDDLLELSEGLDLPLGNEASCGTVGSLSPYDVERLSLRCPSCSRPQCRPGRRCRPAARPGSSAVVIGLSVLTSTTSTSPRIVSPGRTGALKSQVTLRKTVPGPGSFSATTAFRIALVTPPWTTIPPNRDAAAALSS
jgi:hypothetical protein